MQFINVKLRLTAYNSSLLQQNLEELSKEFKLRKFCFHVIPLPVRSRLFTVIKSPFVNKKSREQFKLEIFSRLVLLKVSNIFELSRVLKDKCCEGIAFRMTLRGR